MLGAVIIFTGQSFCQLLLSLGLIIITIIIMLVLVSSEVPGFELAAAHAKTLKSTSGTSVAGLRAPLPPTHWQS
jgi:hypothetical protein